MSIEGLKQVLYHYIFYYEPYILIAWTIFIFTYFIITYKLYKSRTFYVFVILFILGMYLFNLYFPNSLVGVIKQRIRYLDIAYSFVYNRTFAHVQPNGILIDIHPSFCTIPIIFSIVLHGPLSAYKFTLWYQIFSLIITIYLSYKLYKSENKSKLVIFSFLVLFPFIYNEFLNPYDYPEYANSLLFSIFLYLLLQKKDKNAFLILPLLLSSGREYIFFLVSMPFILRALNPKTYIKDTIMYLPIILFISFPFLGLTAIIYITGYSKYFFRADVYRTTISIIEKIPLVYFPFLFFMGVSVYLVKKYFHSKQYIEIILISFFWIFIILLSGWGPNSNFYLYKHYLPNLIPIMLFLLKDFSYKTLSILSVIMVVLTILFIRIPFIFIFTGGIDNLDYLLKFYSHLRGIPKGSVVVFPREVDYQYFHVLGLNVPYYFFQFLNPKILKGTFYFVTSEALINMEDFEIGKVCKSMLKFCNLTVSVGEWRLYKCKGYDKSFVDILSTFKSQNFG